MSVPLTFDFAVEEFQPGGLFLDEDGDDFEDLFDPKEFDFLSPNVLESLLAMSAVQFSPFSCCDPPVTFHSHKDFLWYNAILATHCATA